MTHPDNNAGAHNNDPEGSIFLPDDHEVLPGDHETNLNQRRFALLLGRGVEFDLVVAATAYDPTVHPDTDEIMDSEPNREANIAAEKRIIEVYEAMQLAQQAMKQCVAPVAPIS